MKIQVLGSGCPKCQQLEANTKKAVEELGLSDANIEHVYDIEKIIEMGIMMTPALSVDEKIVIAGKVSSVDEIKAILKDNK